MERKAKILFIVEAFGGGVFEYCRFLCNRLCDDFEIYLAYGVRRQTPKDFQNDFSNKIHFIHIRHFARSIRPLEDFKAMRELNEVYHAIKPDVVHLHSSKAGAIGRILLAGKKVPVFYTPHGYSFLMKDSSKCKRAVYFGMEYLLARTGATTISCSLGEHNETLRLTKRARYISNGIDTHEIDGYIQGLQEESHPFTVCTMGRICGQKNPRMVNQVAQLLPDVRFLWIGEGEERGELTAPNVKITGWMERREAVQTMRRSDIMLLPSLWEGLPLTLLEAMYCRRLCIVSDVVGNRDVIQNHQNGLICHTPEEYAEAIQWARNHPEDAGRLKQAAYDDVMKSYNLEVMAQQYRKLYQEQLREK